MVQIAGDKERLDGFHNLFPECWLGSRFNDDEPLDAGGEYGEWRRLEAANENCQSWIGSAIFELERDGTVSNNRRSCRSKSEADSSLMLDYSCLIGRPQTFCDKPSDAAVGRR